MSSSLARIDSISTVVTGSPSSALVDAVPPGEATETRRPPPGQVQCTVSDVMSSRSRTSRGGPPRPHPLSSAGQPRGGSYPQDAQSAVEMLIIQRSQIAAFSVLRPLAACLERPYIPSCAEHGAGVGRSSTGRPYGAARKSRSGKSVGAVDETATDSATFFGPPHAAAPRLPARLGSPRCTRPVRRASTRA